MYATAAAHLPHPLAAVSAAVLAGAADPVAWFPALHHRDDRPLDELGARLELVLPVPGGATHVPLEVTDVVRTTVTARGRTDAGDDVCLRLSLSPWNGGTAVVVSIDAGDEPRPLLSWSLTRRLEAALGRLAGQLAAHGSAVAPARP
ncbi:MAG: hypothetical protein KY457_10140 [Actinobacteria bacterium]|nr:hypothetical protein [Actinomycetota bacterium]